MFTTCFWLFLLLYNKDSLKELIKLKKSENKKAKEEGGGEDEEKGKEFKEKKANQLHQFTKKVMWLSAENQHLSSANKS